MDKYERAVAIWIGRRTGDDPDDITDVEFDVIEGGYCETCEYTTMGIRYAVSKIGRNHNVTREFTMQYGAPAEFVREVSEILQGELSE